MPPWSWACISTLVFLPGPHRAKGLHWVFEGTVSFPDVTVRPTHTAGPLVGRLRMSSRGACADCALLPGLCPQLGRMASCLLRAPSLSGRAAGSLNHLHPPAEGVVPSESPGCPLGKQGAFWPSDSGLVLKYLPKMWSEWDKTRASENPGSHVQPFLPSTRNLPPAPSGSRRTRQSTAVTSQTCTCSRPGRSKREI